MECNKIYLGETGRKFKIRMNGHAKGERDKTTNPLYERHFNESGHKFINPNENMECNKLYLDETGKKFKIRMNEHARGEGCLLYTSRCV